jgi:hypothetical protein
VVSQSAGYHFWSRPIFVVLLFVLVLFGRRFVRVVFGFVVWFGLGVIEEKSMVCFVLIYSVFCVQSLKRLKASISSKKRLIRLKPSIPTKAV